MAVVYTKSAALTARDTAGTAQVGSYQVRGNAFNAVGKVEVANGDSIASIYRMVTVPSNARIVRVMLRITGTITTAAGDIGVYKATQHGGAVVDADIFASAQALSTAMAAWTDVTNESASITATLAEKRLWEVVGLTADPGIDYDVAITLTAAAGAAGQITLMVEYVI